MLSHIVSNSGITVVFDDGPKMLHKSSARYQEALDALKSSDISTLREIMDPRGAIKKYSNNELSFEEDGSLSFEGLRLGSKLESLLKSCMSRGLPWEVIARFATNCLANPSTRAHSEIESLLSIENLPITEDGCFLAYKLATVDGLDADHGIFDCSPGKTVEYPRNKISRHSKKGPERGLSAGGKAYTNSGFVGKTLVVKINPADVIGVYMHPYREAVVCRFSVVKEGALDFASDIVDSTTLEPLRQVK
jgi:hypothetical protein